MKFMIMQFSGEVHVPPQTMMTKSSPDGTISEIYIDDWWELPKEEREKYSLQQPIQMSIGEMDELEVEIDHFDILTFDITIPTKKEEKPKEQEATYDNEPPEQNQL
jgi:hypothetical protein